MPNQDLDTLRLTWLARRLRVSIERARLIAELAFATSTASTR